MGKKQHQSDKLYLTTKEWKDIYGGHKDDTATKIQRAQFKRLPFTHCALSFLPFEDPVCTPDGIIYDLSHITPYIKKHGLCPVSGKKLTNKDLTVLTFAKDKDGSFRCPVTYKIFTQTSIIAAIRTTGNVYSMEAIDELNLKRNHLKDLLTDTPFQRKDIIILQDPQNLDKFNIEHFYHVQFDTKTKETLLEEKLAMQSPKYFLNSLNNEAKEALSQLEKQYVQKTEEKPKEQIADSINAAHFSQGKVAAGLTSTTMEPVTNNKAAILDEDDVKYSRVTRNGYVRIVTNFGPLNLELFCKHAPRACENFIVHCRNGYYNNTIFHRIVSGFVLQGGDPTGTGTGGESIWDRPFKDEFQGTYKHDQRGILSMANRGTDTNRSQFFITFAACPNLDGKHTVFGRLVGGATTLCAIENVETDKEDRPLENVKIMAAEVFVDPFEAAAEAVKMERKALSIKANSVSEEETNQNRQQQTEIQNPKSYSSGVGKYIKPEIRIAVRRAANEDTSTIEVKKKVPTIL
uniref:RING-type E3 ubiquitin transferase n=1 Tax=Meloidogyne incognita TaxID=6306 RepID=A0A914MX26_MELIC